MGSESGYGTKKKMKESGSESDQVLPLEIQLIILSSMQIEDLFRSCLLVCKPWKDAILYCDCFARLHRARSLWGYLRSRMPRDSEAPYYPNKGLVFQNGPYNVLNAMLQVNEEIYCFDKGIVCAMTCHDVRKWDHVKIRVGNPIKDNWKEIPPPSQKFIPIMLRVNTSTSPAAFKILAAESEDADADADPDPNRVQMEIFDSTTNTWSKGNEVSLMGPSQSFALGTVPTTKSRKQSVTYGFERSVKSYLSPERADWQEMILSNNEELILASGLWPKFTLQREKSCSKGIINWDLLVERDIKDFLAHHNLEIECEKLTWYSHWTWPGFVIILVIHGSSEKIALVNYDLKKDFLEFGGLMEGPCACAIQIRFTPSLITI